MVQILKSWINPISVGHLHKVIFTVKPKCLCIAFILIIVLTIEVFVYFFSTFTWYFISCNVKSECTRILLVADPQIIGLQNEPFHFLTPLTIWDSDRYLSKTYSYAYHFAQPDVVIFLGDLLDEGSTGTDEEFRSYVRRLFNIFLKGPYENVQHVWIPGDNDIGGEAGDRITENKIKRFDHAFQQPDIIKIKNIKFFKINRLTSLIPKFKEQYEFNNLDNIRIGVSHLPLLMIPTFFVDKVLDKMHPHVLFTAHNHKSMIVSTNDQYRNDRLITPITEDNNRIYQYFLGLSELYEILVPTCSYRMGTTKIGYGFAVLESGSLQYTVLWSPSRYTQLIIYAFLVVVGIIYLVVVRFSKCIRKENFKSYTRLYNKA